MNLMMKLILIRLFFRIIFKKHDKIFFIYKNSFSAVIPKKKVAIIMARMIIFLIVAGLL